MAKRSKEEALETRESILDAAVQVFHTRGVSRPSLSDVAELAGVTRGAVYGHFKNKADLFDALCERVRLPTEVVCEGRQMIQEDDPLGELRITWLVVLYNAVGDWQPILDIIFHRCEIVEDNGRIRERLLAGHAEAAEQISGLLTRAVAQGQLSPKLDIPLAAVMAHGTLAGLLSNWLLAPQSFDLAAHMERCVDVVIETLRHNKALQKPD
jgi:TetR/AcrR family acrAB operon transcriptional repressor